MDNLRLILIVLGVIILAAIVLFHRPKGHSQRNHARLRQGRREPGLGAAVDEESEEGSSESEQRADDEVTRQASFPTFERHSESAAAVSERASPPGRDAAPAARPNQPAAAPVSAPDKIITLYIRRREGQRINGSELLDAAVKAGLAFGEMNIFHRRQEGAKKPVFSMANLTPPGHFDASAWNVFDTPGVALFATLPGPVSGLDAWDAMLATGTRIAELLDADLLDDAKCLLSRQRIGQLREEMREYDRLNGLGSL